MNTIESSAIDLFEVLTFASLQKLLSWTLENVPTEVVMAEPGTGKSAELSRLVRQLDSQDPAHNEVRP